LLSVWYLSHAKQPAEATTIGVQILWHRLTALSHCCAARIGDVFAINLALLTLAAENAKMAPASILD